MKWIAEKDWDALEERFHDLEDRVFILEREAKPKRSNNANIGKHHLQHGESYVFAKADWVTDKRGGFVNLTPIYYRSWGDNTPHLKLADIKRLDMTNRIEFADMIGNGWRPIWVDRSELAR